MSYCEPKRHWVYYWLYIHCEPTLGYCKCEYITLKTLSGLLWPKKIVNVKTVSTYITLSYCKPAVSVVIIAKNRIWNQKIAFSPRETWKRNSTMIRQFHGPHIFNGAHLRGFDRAFYLPMGLTQRWGSLWFPFISDYYQNYYLGQSIQFAGITLKLLYWSAPLGTLAPAALN